MLLIRQYKGRIPSMRDPLLKFGIFLACLFLTGASTFGIEPNDSDPNKSGVKAAVIVCKGMIDGGLYKSIERRTNMALEQGATYLIYEISTYGGLVDAADKIAKYFILETGKKAHTVAFITTEAISAGAMISVSCQDIIMIENATIGDCAPISFGGKLEGVEREKAESFIRAAFKRAAKANGYPQALLEAMVTMTIEVYSVKNLTSGEYEFFETPQLPKDANAYDLENKTLIVPDDRLLTLTASEAFEYGIARAVVADREEAIEFLAGRNGVTFLGKPMVLLPNWSEQMVRWINSPAVMGILVMVAMLGVYVELNTPGLGLPGLVAVICFVIIIGSKYLVGLANWVEVALFVIGLLLLMIEIFVLPGFGIAGISGIMCMVVGLFGMLIKNPPERFPWPQSAFDWQSVTNGVLAVGMGFVGFVILAWILTRYLPRLEFLSGLILVPAVPRKDKETPVSMTGPVVSEGIGVNIGDIGEVVSALRPTGKAKFGEHIVDVVAEAEFLEMGTEVEIIEIHGNRVVVKARD